MAATVARGLTSSPQRMIISSYHHHSRQTEVQVGTARRTRVDHPRRQSTLGLTQESRRQRQRLRSVRTMAAATPAMPMGTWRATEMAEEQVIGRVMLCVRR
ncbi:unnamed protein product [Spirodela intermedia]|uniref:Uncharacterized protein n=1 Tax=Spirodela intermedia TaxID=51605 RepID=A0A7I8JVN2_SPIIN|nr:unnamed protein product [Spirodela intermedia]